MKNRGGKGCLQWTEETVITSKNGKSCQTLWNLNYGERPCWEPTHESCNLRRGRVSPKERVTVLQHKSSDLLVRVMRSRAEACMEESLGMKYRSSLSIIEGGHFCGRWSRPTPKKTNFDGWGSRSLWVKGLHCEPFQQTHYCKLLREVYAPKAKDVTDTV